VSPGSARQRVAVVTGGAAGIGAAIAEELGRQGAYVVTLDPVVSVDGSSRAAAEGPTTAQRIVDAGGKARASDTSVTDREAIEHLFFELAEEFGSLDAVVNVAGISRPTDFASGSEEDWAAVLDVHLNGYLNVLGAALPLMEAAGHGRILGVTSGSGWRPANTGAYGCAKRAVAALTWQIGRTTPEGVTVNALSPIAATRMVTAALPPPPPLSAAGGTGREERDTRTGGLGLGSMPPPEHLGPVGAYLAGEEFSWCRGRVIFSGGSELALITPPRLLEVCRSRDVRSLPHTLAKVVRKAFVTAETAQATNGGSNPRFPGVFDQPAPEAAEAPGAITCAVVTDDPAWGAALVDALASQGVAGVGLGAVPEDRRVSAEVAGDFEAAGRQLSEAARDAGPLDAVVVALRDPRDGARGGSADNASGDGWRRVLDEHAGITRTIRTDAGWARAVAEYAAGGGRPVRLVTLTDATFSGGRSRAQSAAQLARSAHTATSDQVDAFAISVETAEPDERRPLAELVTHLVRSPEVGALSGAELVAAAGWFGLRSHPRPGTTVTFGGPAVPEWVDLAMRSAVDEDVT
jgi:NAD(P)-dependent dehydrogenase (short-subunit alcohol dehydrogenase family)